MQKILAAVIVSLLAGLAAGAWLAGGNATDDAEMRTRQSGDGNAAASPTEARLLRIEQAIVDEQNARNVLEEQLQMLIDEIDRIDALGPRAFSDDSVPEPRPPRQADRRAPRDFSSMIRNYQDRRVRALVDAGFADDEARRIIKQESAAQFRAMQMAHEAQRRNEAVDLSSAMSAPQTLLRAEIGDDSYERYLEAQGMPTAVQITQVLEGSPGNDAGLQPGDDIVSYNGERVFTIDDIRQLTLQGTAGEDVVIEIDRDGVRMQLNLPRGPVGITGTGANIRNRNWWGGG